VSRECFEDTKYLEYKSLYEVKDNKDCLKKRFEDPEFISRALRDRKIGIKQYRKALLSLKNK
jgi:hypothetical protein